jgi:cold shock CspA family protein
MNPEKLAAFDVQWASFDPDQRVEGVVHEWNSRGFGFIHFPDNKRAYVHNSSCGGAHLEPGEHVSCLLTQDEKNSGKLMAKDILRLGTPPGSMSADALSGGRLAISSAPGTHNTPLNSLLEGLLGSNDPSQVLLPSDTPGEDGTVVGWHESGGYGFLTMDDNRRAYIHRNSFGGAGSLDVGMRLRVKTAPDNLNPQKWCVQEVVGQIAAESEVASVAAAAAAATTSEPLPDSPAPETVVEVAPDVDESFGITPSPVVVDESCNAQDADDCVVTEWNQAGGYGFVLMDDKRRAFIHRNTFGGQGDLLLGMRLRVITQPDPRNPGKWCVGEIIGELLGEPPPSAWSQGQPETGVVAEWNQNGGYGFLNMDDGKRAYIHRNFFGGSGDLVIGSRLKVTTRPDPRNPGKFCVENVVAFDEAEEAPAGAKRPRLGY